MFNCNLFFRTNLDGEAGWKAEKIGEEGFVSRN